MKIDVRNDPMGEHYALVFEPQMGINVSNIIHRTSKNIIIHLDNNMDYIKHEIKEKTTNQIKKPTITKTGRGHRCGVLSKDQLLLIPETRKILELVETKKFKRGEIVARVGCTETFIKRVFVCFEIEHKAHKYPRFKND